MHSNLPAGSDAYPPDDPDVDELDELDELDEADVLDLPAPGDRYRIRLDLCALDGTRVAPGTIATFVSRVDRPGLGPLWNMLRTDDGRDVPVLIDPISVDKLPNEVSA